MQLWFCHPVQCDQHQVPTDVWQASCWAGLHGRHIHMDKAYCTKASLPAVGRQGVQKAHLTE